MEAGGDVQEWVQTEFTHTFWKFEDCDLRRISR